MLNCLPKIGLNLQLIKLSARDMILSQQLICLLSVRIILPTFSYDSFSVIVVEVTVIRVLLSAYRVGLKFQSIFFNFYCSNLVQEHAKVTNQRNVKVTEATSNYVSAFKLK